MHSEPFLLSIWHADSLLSGLSSPRPGLESRLLIKIVQRNCGQLCTKSHRIKVNNTKYLCPLLKISKYEKAILVLEISFEADAARMDGIACRAGLDRRKRCLAQRLSPDTSVAAPRLSARGTAAPAGEAGRVFC